VSGRLTSTSAPSTDPLGVEVVRRDLRGARRLHDRAHADGLFSVKRRVGALPRAISGQAGSVERYDDVGLTERASSGGPVEPAPRS